MSSNQERIKALPTDVGQLQRSVLQLQDAVASFEEAKRQRAAAEAELASAPGADFALEMIDVKAGLEGLADASEDITDPRTRSRIVKAATGLLDRMLAALQQK